MAISSSFIERKPHGFRHFRLSFFRVCTLLIVGLLLALPCSAVFAQTSDQSYRTDVQPFFKKHCLKCHGPETSKGDLTLDRLDPALATDTAIEQWELVLDALRSETMPPEEEPRPDDEERKRVVDWIDRALRDRAQTTEGEDRATTRRLTNFEYQNTMRDLLGIDLKLIDRLPKDPIKPYHFNNTAEMMLLGPEQIDRYLEAARYAMASVIVDGDQPKKQVTKKAWKATERRNAFGKMLNQNEIPIHSSPRGTPGHGMSVKQFPRTGEFRVRFQAAAVFPNGATELPLRLVMGYNLNINSSTQQIAPVGVVRLRNSPEQPQVYELRGRIENFPVELGKIVKNKRRPDSITITPQNIYDDGTLNDENRFLYWPRQPEMPRAVIDWMEFEAPINDVWPPTHHQRILFESPERERSPDDYIREVLTRFMTRAYRRPATPAEVDRFQKIYDLLKPELITIEATLRETLAMVLVTPQFLLHTKADGQVVKPSAELASRLSYFLWASMPDDELLACAKEGRLTDPVVMSAQVQRMLADPRAMDFVANFSKQWLSLEKMKTVPINRDLFPRFLYYVEAGERKGTEKPYRPTIRDYMIEETIAFVAELIRRNASVTNLVDSDFAMLNQPLAAHYGVDGVEGDQLRPVPIEPDDHLGGLLTHGSVLIGNSTGSAPHPIYRAVWLREAILGEHVKPPPAEVPALADSAGDSGEKATSIGDLLAKHRSVESCNDCHARLDPWGIPFERYNAIGKFQPLVPKEGTRVRGFNRKQDVDLAGYEKYLQTVNTQQVQALARVPSGPKIDGMLELKKFLLKERKDDIAENVVRRLFSYGLGRELNYRDRPAVSQVLSQTRKEGFLFRDIIIAVCQSPAFQVPPHQDIKSKQP